MRGRYAQRSGIPALSIGHWRGSGVLGLRCAHGGGCARSQGTRSGLHLIPLPKLRAVRKIHLRGLTTAARATLFVVILFLSFF
jgi:hypothetical protein